MLHELENGNVEFFKDKKTQTKSRKHYLVVDQV